MTYFEDKGKDIILHDEMFTLKITSDRDIYCKLKNEPNFTNLGLQKVPLGYSLDSKKSVLMKLNEKILSQYGNQIDAKINGDNKVENNKIGGI